MSKRQRIESLFLTDSFIRDRVLAAEQELIDDYLEDRLSTADRETFLWLYGYTAAQQRRLRIAKSIQEWAVGHKTSPASGELAISMWNRLLAELRLKPVIAATAVTVTVLIVVAFISVNSHRSAPQKQFLAIQQELVDLNRPSSLREIPPQLSFLTLPPGSVRSVEPEPELKRWRVSSIAELRLLWMQKEEYPTYLAVVRRPGDNHAYTVPDLTSDKENGKVIRLRLPAHLLILGTPQIELSGVSADGTKSPTEIYSFTVSE
jgi:hypothetical protein